MKRRFLSGLFACLAIVMICTVAKADVIWEPNDAFYRNKYEDCKQVGRSFTANGADGTVTVWKEPGSKKEVATIQNGNPFYVSFTYTDKNNKIWGVVQFTYEADGATKAEYSNAGKTGWIEMADLALIYDYISFDEEHKSEFKPYTGDYKTLMTGDELVFWSYPGSGVIAGTRTDIDDNFSLSHTYTDAEGRQWGYVNYYYGTRNCWVCISDPANKAIPAVKVESTPLTPSQTEVSTFPSEKPVAGKFPVLILLAGLVAVLVIGTAILIRLFWKRK